MSNGSSAAESCDDYCDGAGYWNARSTASRQRGADVRANPLGMPIGSQMWHHRQKPESIKCQPCNRAARRGSKTRYRTPGLMAAAAAADTECMRRLSADFSDIPPAVSRERRRQPDRRVAWRGGRRDDDWVKRPLGALTRFTHGADGTFRCQRFSLLPRLPR